MFEYGDMLAGAAAFQNLLDHSLRAMRDFRDDYIRNGVTTAQADYDALAARYAEVSVLANANPGSTFSFAVYLEAVECSEEAALLVDLSTGLVLVIHQGPGC